MIKCRSKESGGAVRAGRLPTGQRPSHKPAQAGAAFYAGNALGKRMTNDPALKGLSWCDQNWTGLCDQNWNSDGGVRIFIGVAWAADIVALPVRRIGLCGDVT